MTIGYLDIEVRKGAQVVQPILVTTDGAVIPLVPGTTALMQIRANANSDTVLAELSTTNSRLEVDENGAKVTITMSAAFTGTFDFERARYDLILRPPGGQDEVIVEGKIFVFPSVTRTS
jgi:hypothetical protein